MQQEPDNPSFLGLPRRRTGVAVAIVVVLSLVGIGGGAEAARRYDRATTDVLLPGTVIGGIPVGGLGANAARGLLHDIWEEPLDQPVEIRAGAHTATVTMREIGAATDVDDRLQDALDDQRSRSMWSRLWHRVSGEPVADAYDVARYFDQQRFEGWLGGFAEHSRVEPVNSTVDVSSGFVELTDERDGWQLERAAATDAMERALALGSPSVEMPGETIAPAVRRSDHGTILLVRVGENRLYRYHGDDVVRSYPVATGEPSYPTPLGRWEITLKRRNPVWINPAPDRWGASLPARIGPGPSNPLGTRALNLNASGIRIHGTSDRGSIGYNASHGCIRMLREHVEALFEDVAVGTPVYIVRAGAYKVRSGGGGTVRAEGA